MDFAASYQPLLKPGVMFRRETDEAWTLFQPLYNLACRFTTVIPQDDELGRDDLLGDDRCWRGGELLLDRFHTAQAFRAHRDNREANLEINYQCHYGCRHCFQSLLPAVAAAATPDWPALQAAADRLLAAGREISVTGGDIFLQPQLWSLLDYLHERSPATTLRLLVNGGGVDLGDGRWARLRGRRLLVKTDFFGHSAELHDEFTRVPGSFEKLVRLTEVLLEHGLNFLATGALTRRNFATRFELVNFLHNLTRDRFTIATLIYPSDHRRADDLAAWRLTGEQQAELLEESFFTPLLGEYHSFERQCAGDCQFTVVSASGDEWGCSFLKLGSQGRGASLTESVTEWRSDAARRAQLPDCPVCPAQRTCRRCPSFLQAVSPAETYCDFSRRAFEALRRRLGQAWRDGFRFVHQEAAELLPPPSERSE